MGEEGNGNKRNGKRETERVVSIRSKPKVGEVKQQRYEEEEEMMKGFGKSEREKVREKRRAKLEIGKRTLNGCCCRRKREGIETE
ncbi:hypothetical protein HKD37_13G037788 [Glycine soja]